jgi:hypothetical protein
MTMREIKAALRRGEFAFPGGYQLYFVTEDGAALSFKAARQMWREIVAAYLTGGAGSDCAQWRIAAESINWEDESLVCDHTGELIPAAYSDADA